MSAVTVVVATFGRGAAIRPTLASIARQTLADVEVLVVSDGPPADDLAETVAEFGFVLHALPERVRSQSGPNTLGWSLASSPVVAYLGHDDIWHPEHLSSLVAVLDANPSADFAVTGCLYLGDEHDVDDALTWVTGLFEGGGEPLVEFYPPSSIAHRRVLPGGVDSWPDRATSRRPVDFEFMAGAAASGAVFAASDRITTFKFASAARYLAYLVPEASEQQRMLDRLDDPAALDAFVATKVAIAQAQAHYRHIRLGPDDVFDPQARIEQIDRLRGIELGPVAELDDSAWIPVGDESRPGEWYGPETNGQQEWRWSGPASTVRLLVNHGHAKPVTVRVHLTQFAADDIRDSLRVLVNGMPVDAVVAPNPISHGLVIAFEASLPLDRVSVLEFRMNRTALASEIDPETADARRLGFCLLGVELATVPRVSRAYAAVLEEWARRG